MLVGIADPVGTVDLVGIVGLVGIVDLVALVELDVDPQIAEMGLFEGQVH